jgi:hypothetical protein
VESALRVVGAPTFVVGSFLLNLLAWALIIFAFSRLA